MKSSKAIVPIFFALSGLGFSTTSQAFSSITFQQIEQDIHTLASDEMGGRASFTNEIDQAGDYIARRFAQIGLKPLSGNSGYQQTFSIFQIKPDSIQVTINGDAIADEKVMLLSTHEKLNWDQSSDVKIHKVSAAQDFRQAMSELNQKHGNMLVLVDPAHQDAFARYRNHFHKGNIKFEHNQGPSAVFVIAKPGKIQSFTAEATTTSKRQTLTNMVGVLPGKERADEMVLFSAHYDHIGVKPENEGDKIYNGADDDASGTTAVINLANYYAKRGGNQRSLVFVAFTAEEIGGFGSKYFSRQLSPEKIVAMVNIEMIGKPSKFGNGALWMTGFERSNLAELMNAHLNDSEIHADPYPQQKLFYRSDNATLARLGVPAHSFSSSQIDKDQHYHQASDEVSSLDLKSMHQVINTLAKASQGLVDGKDTPTRVDTSQVKKSGNFF